MKKAVKYNKSNIWKMQMGVTGIQLSNLFKSGMINESDFKNYLKSSQGLSDDDIANLSISELISMYETSAEEYIAANGINIYELDENENEELSEIIEIYNEIQEEYEDGLGKADDSEFYDESAQESENINNFETQTETETPNNAESETYEENKPENSNILTKEQIYSYTDIDELLEDMYQDDEILSIIDENGDEIISDKEREKFEAYIKGDKENLELDDIKEILGKIKDSNFDIEDYKNFQVKDTSTENTEESKNTDSASYGGDGGGINYTPSSDQTEKDITNMSLEELTSLRDTTQSTFDEQKSELTSIMDGSNEDIKNMEENIANLLDAYETAIAEQDEAVAQEVKQAEEEYNNQKKAVNCAEADTILKETALSEAETTLTNANSTLEMATAAVEANQAALDSARAAGTSEDDPDGSMQAATIAAIESALNAALEAQSAAQEAYNTALENKNNAESDLQEAKAKEQEAKELLQEKEEAQKAAEAKVSELIGEDTESELYKAKMAYEEAKESYHSIKDQVIASAKASFSETQDYLNKINTQITIKENKIKEREITYTDKADTFVDNPEIFSEWHQKDGMNEMSYLLIGPKNPDPNKKYPAIVVLHGADEFGTNQQAALNAISRMEIVKVMIDGKATTMTGEQLSHFNGYVVVPQAKSGHWYVGNNGESGEVRMNQVTAVLDEVSSRFNIDSNNIAIAGHSAGGVGALYFASHYNDFQNKYTLTSCTLFGSAASTRAEDLQNIDIPTQAFYGNGDNATFSSSLAGVQTTSGEYIRVTRVENQTCHGGREAQVRDVNRNGIADWLEFVADNFS